MFFSSKITSRLLRLTIWRPVNFGNLMRFVYICRLLKSHCSLTKHTSSSPSVYCTGCDSKFTTLSGFYGHYKIKHVLMELERKQEAESSVLTWTSGAQWYKKNTAILLPTYRRYSTHLPKLREYKCYVRSVVRILISDFWSLWSEDVPEVKLWWITR